MKKILLLIAIGLMNVSCCKEWKNNSPGKWYVYNQTDRKLKLKCPRWNILAGTFEEEIVEIPSKDYRDVYHVEIPNTDPNPFPRYFEQSVAKFGEDVSWQVMAEDGTVLKTWRYSERALPGQRFFDKASWAYGFSKIQLGLRNEHSWKFVIKEKDLPPAE